MPSALMLIADGTEEMEFTITYDTLIRAGVQVTSAFVPDTSASTPQVAEGHKSISPVAAKGSRGINIMPDTYFDNSISGPDKYDVLIIPGGAKGAETISQSSQVQELVRKFLSAEKYVAMICAGSITARKAGVSRRKITSHPSVQQFLEKDYEYSEDPVVVADNLITSRGPGTAFPFAFKLVELLCGKEKRDEVIAPMIFPAGTPLQF